MESQVRNAVDDILLVFMLTYVFLQNKRRKEQTSEVNVRKCLRLFNSHTFPLVKETRVSCTQDEVQRRPPFARTSSEWRGFSSFLSSSQFLFLTETELIDLSEKCEHNRKSWFIIDIFTTRQGWLGFIFVCVSYGLATVEYGREQEYVDEYRIAVDILAALISPTCHHNKTVQCH